MSHTQNPFEVPTEGSRGLSKLLDRLGTQAFLERTLFTPLYGETGFGLGIDAYRRSDTTTFESNYPCGAVNATALTTSAPSTNTLVAVPFVAESPQPWDRIKFEVTTVSAGSGLARVGIYDAKRTSDGLLYPGQRIVNGSETDVSAGGGTGAKSTTIAVTPEVGRVYFAAYLCGTSAPTVRGIAVGGLRGALGFQNALGSAATVAYTVAHTYVSAIGLPESFPSGATAHAVAVPAIWLRHSEASAVTRRYPHHLVRKHGYELRQAALVSSADVPRTTSASSFTVAVAHRSGATSDVLGSTFDSTQNRLTAGTPWVFTGEDDLDTPLSANDILEAKVTTVGVPPPDLSTLSIAWTISYVGGSD